MKKEKNLRKYKVKKLIKKDTIKERLEKFIFTNDDKKTKETKIDLFKEQDGGPLGFVISLDEASDE